MSPHLFLSCTEVEIKRERWSNRPSIRAIVGEDAVTTLYVNGPEVEVQPDGDGCFDILGIDGLRVSVTFVGEPRFTGNAYRMLEADEPEEEDEEEGEHPSVTVPHPATI